MSRSQAPTKRVVVTGDVTIDWNIARRSASGRPGATWSFDDTSRACWHRGGAAMLADLLEAITAHLGDAEADPYQIHQMNAPVEGVSPGDRRFNHSYAIWEPHAKGAGDEHVWRVKEFLGVDAAQPEEPRAADDWRLVVDDPDEARLVVLDDAALGFRDERRLWPAAVLAQDKTPWILLKQASPLCEGQLWEHLVGHAADRTVAVMTVGDLRRTDVQISRELSWERTAQDLYWELTRNPRVSDLSRCAHLVVSLYGAGALVLSRQVGEADAAMPDWDCVLVFDPSATEGRWAEGQPGGMVGFTTCLAAALAQELLVSPPGPDIVKATRIGVAAMRCLQLGGYGAQPASPELSPPTFPFQEVTACLTGYRGTEALASQPVQDPTQFLPGCDRDGEAPPKGEYWTILEAMCRSTKPQTADSFRPLADLAAQVVIEGPERALTRVPRAQFGKLVTADRREIEGYRSIATLIREYDAGPQRRPLSIAVFGPPGSGKSFGVTEVAKDTGLENVQDIEFNLSQVNGAEALADALHQVRDLRLSGALPLVFWDEFDTTLDGKELGWLRYFLVPMQDGKFQQGQITHSIGPAIFVFAGGTSHSMAAFGRDMTEPDRRRAKVPDFVSRLKGYVNVMGPDPQTRVGGPGDSCWIVRRGMLLRSILSRNAPTLFAGGNVEGDLSIDSGVLRAFLHVSRYHHGARSMEAIVNMSSLAGRQSFQRSSLPAEDQLDLHVNGREFLSLVQMPALTGALLNALGEAAHEVYREEAQRQLNSGEITELPPAAQYEYSQLPDDLAELNRGNVRDIPLKLASVGYVMIPARSSEPPLGFPGDDLDRLAEMEHDRWLRQKVAQGWVYGPTRDDEKKTSPALLPWRDLSDEERAELDPPVANALGDGVLSESEKEKDRVLVRAIPLILAKAGYAVARVSRT